MLRELMLISVLICVTKCEHSHSSSIEELYAVLDQTTDYFKELSNAHEVDIDTSSDINDAISKYVENTKTILSRSKRDRWSLHDLKPGEGVNVLQDFEETLSVELPEFRDVAFFSVQDEYELLWYAAAVDSANILLYQLVDNNNTLLVDTYPQSDGKRIMVNNYSAGTLIVLQTDTDRIFILRLDKNRNGDDKLQFKQEFEIAEVMHMNMWLSMNQLYLGIVSKESTFIYVWLGEYFDKIDTLHFVARKLLPFQSKSFMHIVALGASTMILRFSVRSNKFEKMQKLRHITEDVSSFQFRESHFEESFLVLAGNDSTILYKEMYGHFVPFQRIAPAKYVHSLRMGNTALLFTVNEDTAEIYQYDGWRFLKLQQKLSNIRRIHLYNEDVLMAQHQDGQWKFLKPVWNVNKSWRSLQKELKTWFYSTAQKASQRMSVKIPDKKNLVISNAHIGRLHVQNLNDRNTDELIRLGQQYKSTIVKLNSTKSILAEEAKRSRRKVLRGKKLTVRCETNCHIHRIITDNKIKSAIKYEPVETLELAKVKVKTLDNWKCPLLNFAVDDVSVKGSINGILMQDLQERTLKVSGDQEVSGNHVFANLHATNVSIPLDIATNTTNQKVRIKEARVKELYLTEDFLLPLNGTSTVMTGSLTATEVKVTGPVELKGGISGEGIRKLQPVKEILTPLTLPGDRFLQNVTFRNVVRAKDIVSADGSSLKAILENSIPLDSNALPTHLILSSDKIQWSNVTLVNYTNWVTKNSAETVVISGTKFANNSVTLTNATYVPEILNPKLTIPLCATGVITPDIRTSLITIDDLNVRNLNVSHILGAYDLNATFFDSVSTLQSVDFSTKRFTGHVFVKNISASEIKGTDLKDLNIQLNKWIDVNRIKGPVNVKKLVVSNLEAPAYFNFPLPTKVRNLIVKADSKIKKINGINVQSFMENVVKVDDMISLEHATFTHGFTSDHVHVSHSPLNISYLDAPLNLHSKRISTTLKTDAINVPQTFGYSASDEPSTFIVQGSVTFLREPVLQNVNGVNLTQLSKDMWLADQDTVISGSNMNITNMIIEGPVLINDFSNSLNVKLWYDLSDKFLSKTKEQNITVVSSFKDVVASSITAADNSTIQSSDSDLNNMLTNSLMRDAAQVIDAQWHFEELYISDTNWNGKLNGLDLSKDIVRHDAKENIITGQKTVLGLRTKDLWWLNSNFSSLVSQALTQNCEKLSVIKGQKTFTNISLNNLSVKGTIMGRNVAEALLMYGNQTVHGIEKIRGQLNAPSLIIDGTINDVNLTELINSQLKKNKTMQTIEGEFDFRNDLEIFGNITIGGLYEKIDLKNIKDYSKLNAVLDQTMEVRRLSEDIASALQNRAIYINKFEAMDENVLEITSNTSNSEDMIDLSSTCPCEPKNISSLCNDTKLWDILGSENSSALIMKKLVLLDDDVFIVLISSDFVSIYLYVDTEEQLYQKAGLSIPNIFQASAVPIDNSLWIILRLSEQTLILRYQAWNSNDELERYVLPGSYKFVISKTPNNQHLLIRSDGMWNLEGLQRPKHIFEIPLNGEIKTFALGADYYVKATTENSTTVLKARYVGN